MIPGLEPITGDPDAVEGKAVQLRVMALRFHRANDVLTVLSTSAEWTGPAGSAFAERVRAMPTLLCSVAERFAQAAGALAEFAPGLRAAQRLCDRAIDDHGDQLRELDRLDAELVRARASGDLSSVDRLMANRLACVLRIHDAERRHAAAVAAFDEADQCCAARLFRASHDALDDSFAYDLATGTARLADGVSMRAGQFWWVPGVGEGAQGLALAGGVASTLLRSAVKAVYDDGSWKSIGVNAGLLSVAPIGRGLKAMGLARAGATAAPAIKSVSAPRTLAQFRDRPLMGAWARETVLTSAEFRIAQEAADDLGRVASAGRVARWPVKASVGLRIADQGCTRAGQLTTLSAVAPSEPIPPSPSPSETPAADAALPCQSASPGIPR